MPTETKASSTVCSSNGTGINATHLQNGNHDLQIFYCRLKQKLPRQFVAQMVAQIVAQMVAQMVERSRSRREVRGSMLRISKTSATHQMVITISRYSIAD